MYAISTIIPFYTRTYIRIFVVGDGRRGVGQRRSLMMFFLHLQEYKFVMAGSSPMGYVTVT